MVEVYIPDERSFKKSSGSLCLEKGKIKVYDELKEGCLNFKEVGFLERKVLIEGNLIEVNRFGCRNYDIVPKYVRFERKIELKPRECVLISYGKYIIICNECL